MTRDIETCQEMVGEPPGYWHEHVCGRRAKFIVMGRWVKRRIYVCGTHVKWYQRWSSHPVETMQSEALRVARERIARGEAKPLQIDQERLLPVERALPQRGTMSAPSVTDEETK